MVPLDGAHVWTTGRPPAPPPRRALVLESGVPNSHSYSRPRLLATMPKRPVAVRPPIERLRTLCLALPETHEVKSWGEPTFRVRNKIFAMYAASDNHHGAGRPSVWCKSTHLIQDMLVHEDPPRYFAPPYVGPNGWLGIRLDRHPNWKTVAELLRDAYLLTAPKTLAAALEDH